MSCGRGLKTGHNLFFGFFCMAVNNLKDLRSIFPLIFSLQVLGLFLFLIIPLVCFFFKQLTK